MSCRLGESGIRCKKQSDAKLTPLCSYVACLGSVLRRLGSKRIGWVTDSDRNNLRSLSVTKPNSSITKPGSKTVFALCAMKFSQKSTKQKSSSAEPKKTLTRCRVARSRYGDIYGVHSSSIPRRPSRSISSIFIILIWCVDGTVSSCYICWLEYSIDSGNTFRDSKKAHPETQKCNFETFNWFNMIVYFKRSSDDIKLSAITGQANSFLQIAYLMKINLSYNRYSLCPWKAKLSCLWSSCNVWESWTCSSFRSARATQPLPHSSTIT